MRSLNLAILPALLAAAACGGQAPERGEDAREAEGEVLGGTISDEMLPLDQLQSQSPVLRQKPVGEGDDAAAAEGDEATDEADGGAPPDAPAEPDEPQQ